MSETEDFTPEQRATLERIEAAPYAPEAKFRDMNPLVPTHDIRPAWEVAPHPDLGTGTADEWSRHYLAEAYAHHGLAIHLMRKADLGSGDGDPAVIQEMAEAYARLADSFAIGFLMRHVSDEVARSLGAILEMGETDELAWEWLGEAGINPHSIRSTPTREWLVAERGRLMAERRAAKEAEASS